MRPDSHPGHGNCLIHPVMMRQHDSFSARFVRGGSSKASATYKWIAVGFSPLTAMVVFMGVNAFAESVASAAERQTRLGHSLFVPIVTVAEPDRNEQRPYRTSPPPIHQFGHKLAVAIRNEPIASVALDYKPVDMTDAAPSHGFVQASGHTIILQATAYADTAPLLAGEKQRPAQPVLPPPLPPSPVIAAPIRTDRGLSAVEQHLENMAKQRPIGGDRENLATRNRIETVATRSRPGLTPSGLPLGGFTFFPSFDLATVANSNPLRSTRASADVAAMLTARGELRSNWGRHALDVTGEVENRAQARLSSENATQWNVTSTGVIDIASRSSFQLEGGYGHAVIQRGGTGEVLQTARPVRYDRTYAEATAALEGARIGATLTAGIDQRDFHDARTPTGALSNQQFRDVTEKSIGLSTALIGKPGSSAFLKLERRWFDYRLNQGTNRNSVQSSALLGFRGDITPVIRGTVALGLFHLTFSNPAIRSTTRPAIDAQVDWAVTPLTTVQLAASRSVNSTADPRGVAQIMTSYALRADHELRRNLILNARMAYQTSDYQGVDGQDRRWREQVGANWLVNRNMTLNVTAEGEQRPNSSRAAISYEAYSLRMGVKYAF